jgi:hypothetical protein
VPASKGLEPRFGSVWFDVTEAGRKRRGSAFELSKNSFDSVPISVARHLKSEPCSSERSLEMLGSIDEKHAVFDIVFFAEFLGTANLAKGMGRFGSYWS